MEDWTAREEQILPSPELVGKKSKNVYLVFFFLPGGRGSRLLVSRGVGMLCDVTEVPVPSFYGELCRDGRQAILELICKW
jgi:hypothetical protein